MAAPTPLLPPVQESEELQHLPPVPDSDVGDSPPPSPSEGRAAPTSDAAPAQAENNAAYAYLTYLKESCKVKSPEPVFTATSGSVRTSKIRGEDWNNIGVSIELDVLDEDLAVFTKPRVTPEQLNEHLAFMTSEAKRNTEVRISHLTGKEKELFKAAKEKELDQWVQHAVVKVCKRAGIPLSRIMPMRWVLTRKNSDDGSGKKAKARLVARGYTDPDLVTLRAEAPTLSKQARHVIFQMAASCHFKVERADVKTAFLQGDKTEESREVFLEPVPELRQKLGMGPINFYDLWDLLTDSVQLPGHGTFVHEKIYLHSDGECASSINVPLCFMMGKS